MIPNQVDRRVFLQGLAVTATSVAVGGRTWGQAETGQQPFGNWPIGIQSYSLRNFPVERAIRHVQGLGLHNLEFFSGHFALDSSDEQIDRMLATLRGAQIQLRAHGVNGFTADHAANRAVFEFARKAGIRNITANPERDSFDSLDKLVDEYDIRICIHNHGPARFTMGWTTLSVR